MNMKTYPLKINPDFRQLVFPLSPDERKEMEDSICDLSRLPVIHVWKHYVLTDFAVYECCRFLELPYEVKTVELTCEDEAFAWICENQLKRSTLPKEMRKYLIGRRSMAEIVLGKRESSARSQQETKGILPTRYDTSASRTRARIGKLYGYGIYGVRQLECYATTVDTLRENVPDFIRDHLAGKISASYGRLNAMANLSRGHLLDECKLIYDQESDEKPGTWKSRLLPLAENSEKEPTHTVSIKDMPAYDPDAEISSLTLTIPSWISSIDRVRQVCNISTTTYKARTRLERALTELNYTVQTMLHKVQED